MAGRCWCRYRHHCGTFGRRHGTERLVSLSDMGTMGVLSQGVLERHQVLQTVIWFAVPFGLGFLLTLGAARLLGALDGEVLALWLAFWLFCVRVPLGFSGP